MQQVKDRSEVDFYELINANKMTDELWQDVESYVKEKVAKDWNDYVERKEHFDDAFYRKNSYDDALQKLAEQKGVIYEYVLTKDGEVVPCQIVKTKFGEAWVVKTSWDKNADVVEWVNVSVASTVEKEQKHYAKKGYQIALVEVRGYIYNGQVKPAWSDVKSIEVLK
jgi:hypothetical protein